MIISPDNYLVTPEGEYVWTKERVTRAWLLAMEDLHRELQSGKYLTLALVVGLPGAGKSTWLKENAQDGVLYFDAVLTRRRLRTPLRKAAQEYSIPCDCIWVNSDVETCRRRNDLRQGDRRVSDEVFEDMLKYLLNSPPKMDEGYRILLMV